MIKKNYYFMIITAIIAATVIFITLQWVAVLKGSCQMELPYMDEIYELRWEWGAYILDNKGDFDRQWSLVAEDVYGQETQLAFLTEVSDGEFIVEYEFTWHAVGYYGILSKEGHPYKIMTADQKEIIDPADIENFEISVGNKNLHFLQLP
jgi:hypothetical protein